MLVEFGVDFYQDTKLGEGGFSTVFRAHAISAELQQRAGFQPMAIKKMKGMQNILEQFEFVLIIV